MTTLQEQLEEARSAVHDLAASASAEWLRIVHNVVAHPLLVLWPRAGEWLHDLTVPRAREATVEEWQAIVDAAPAFTCPRCQRVSHNPKDLESGYCGYCHDWTGRPRDGTPGRLEDP